MRSIAVSSAALLALAYGGAAAAQGGGRANVTISAHVAEVCELEAGAATLPEAQVQAQFSVTEMCNTERPFTVLAAYRPLDQGEQVSIGYDGSVLTLASD